MPATFSIVDAVTVLHRGGVIAYPTEGVWGLGCDPFDERAVLRLLALKQRPVDKGLILVAASPAQLDGIVDWAALPRDRHAAVLASWPGPHTWLMPAAPAVPRWITGEHDSVAVRVSAHPVVVALCEAFAGALVSTSANRAAEPAARTRAELEAAIVAGVDAIVAGETSGRARPSSIRDARNGRELR